MEKNMENKWKRDIHTCTHFVLGVSCRGLKNEHRLLGKLILYLYEAFKGYY